MPPKARAARKNPLKAIQPPSRSRNSAQVATPVHKESGRRVKREPSPDSEALKLLPNLADTDDEDDAEDEEVKPPGIHAFPTEILAAVLSLAEHSSEDLVAAQNQRFANALVCKAWSRIISAQHGGETMVVRGFKTSRRLMRVYNAEPERAAATKRLSIDLMREERAGTKAMVADVIQACDNLKELELLFLGREKGSHDAACLTVSIYEAFATRTDLVELTLTFQRSWTALTLGGDFSRSLNKLPHLRRLHLPVILVPRIDAAFPFSPSLTHLSMHVTDAGSLLLLSHFLSSSDHTLLHLRLTIHDSPDLTTLPTLLAPVAAQLLSFSLDSDSPKPYGSSGDAQGLSPAIPFASLLTPMARLESLGLADSLQAPLDVLATLPRLRHLSYRLSSISSYRQLLDFLDAQKEDAQKVEITSLELKASSLFRGVKAFMDEDWRGAAMNMVPEKLGQHCVAMSSSQSMFVAQNRPHTVTAATQVNGCWAEDCQKLDSLQQRFKTCGRCKGAYYCSPEHQKNDWKRHKTECGLLTAQLVRDLAGQGLTPKSLGLVPGSTFVTMEEFQTHLSDVIKDHGSTFNWALYQALNLHDPANHPKDFALPTALMFRFICIDLPDRAGFRIKWDGKLAMGPLATMRKSSPPSHWETYDHLLELVQTHKTKSLGVVFIQGYQISNKQSYMIDLNTVKIDHDEDWVGKLDDAFYNNVPIAMVRSSS
ncbi:hypothetical protein RQP46_004436 [Phenoliferia psychrophenolica]